MSSPAQDKLEKLARSMSVPMSVGRVSSLSELREKRRLSENASIWGAINQAAAREDATRPLKFSEQSTPYWELGRLPFSLARTQSAEELRYRVRPPRELFTRYVDPAPRDPAALNARDAFVKPPEDTRFLHRKLSSGPVRAQRGYPPVTDESLLSGAPKPGQQPTELLKEAALKAEPKDRNIAWTNAHFSIMQSALGTEPPDPEDSPPPPPGRAPDVPAALARPSRGSLPSRGAQARGVGRRLSAARPPAGRSKPTCRPTARAAGSASPARSTRPSRPTASSARPCCRRYRSRPSSGRCSGRRPGRRGPPRPPAPSSRTPRRSPRAA